MIPAGRMSAALACAALATSLLASPISANSAALTAESIQTLNSQAPGSQATNSQVPIPQVPISQIIGRGWQPPVAFAGQGDEKRAVNALREISSLQKVMLSNTRFDEQTEQFVDGLWASFERFDLKKFYDLLPERKGDWHYLQVHGVVENGRYNVGPQVTSQYKNGDRPNDFGEVAVLVKAREMKGPRETYLVDTNVSIGMGTVGWPAVAQAVEETLRIVVKGDNAYSGSASWQEGEVYRKRVTAMNASLGKEDIEILAPLWAAFPAQWDLLATLGHFDDVVVEDVPGADYKKLNARFVINPDKMKNGYPALASHLSNLGSLNKTDLRAVGEQGDVFRVSLDSEKLMARFEAYVKDGYLMPVKDGKVGAQPLTEMFKKPWHLDLLAEARMKILGVVTDMKDMRISLDFTPTENGAKTVASMTRVPDVKVSGNALGIMPTAVIDVLMPSNIDSLMRDFLRVMCEGNGGEGLVTSIEYSQPQGASLATLDTQTTFEGLNNFFVQFGMGIVNDRIIPDPQVSVDLRKLMFDTHQAFSQDLEAYSRVATL